MKISLNDRYVNSDGARIWTTASGQGIPVLLCSGGPGCCDYLQPVADLIYERARVIRFEQRGCGRSDHTPPYDVETCVRDLEAIRLHYRFDRWIVGGHSWGADLALAYALAHPSRSVGLICIAGGRVHNDREWHKIYKYRKEKEGEVLPDYDFPPNLEVNEKVNASWRRYIQHPGLLKAISRLDVPAMFVYGADDIRPSWPVEQLANLIPNATYENITGANHYIWFSHPEILQNHLRSFISQLEHSEN